MPGHDIIVIGASAGGVEALQQLFAGLPCGLPATFFVVLHLGTDGKSLLPQILERASHWHVEHPLDKQRIRHGRIYVAPPDRHLWLENHHIRVTRGPRVNQHRPAIDPLFETAAHSYGSRVVGVVLSGALDDGSAGLYYIKRCGGTTVVQDPKDALVSSMPENALKRVQVDYRLPVAEMQQVLVRLARKPPRRRKGACLERMRLNMEALSTTPDEMQKRNGSPSAFICPECDGPLWKLQDGKLVQFRCLVGHSFSPETLLAEEAVALERALWVAVKTLEERATFLRRLGAGTRTSNSKSFEQKAGEAQQEAKLIRDIITRVKQ